MLLGVVTCSSASTYRPSLAIVNLLPADLPGFTRSVYAADHALVTPESRVFAGLPEW